MFVVSLLTKNKRWRKVSWIPIELLLILSHNAAVPTYHFHLGLYYFAELCQPLIVHSLFLTNIHFWFVVECGLDEVYVMASEAIEDEYFDCLR